MLLDELQKITGNSYASIAEDGIAAGDITQWIDTGSYTLNALLSGSIYKGLAGNKITGFAAESGTGKTFFALGAMKNFLSLNPTGMAVVFESEGSLTRQMLVERGIDVKRVGIVPVETVQQFKAQALRVLDNYGENYNGVPAIFVLDSLGMLSTSKEMEDSASGSDTRDMTRAGQIRSAFRTLTLKMSRFSVPFIVTNHVYANIMGGPYGGNVASGGGGYVYAGSTNLTMTKAKDKDGDDHVGSIITVTVQKGRITKEGSRGKVRIKFSGGLDRYYGLRDLAEEAGVFKKVSTKYELPDGRKIFGKTIDREPEKYYTEEILRQVDEYTQKKFMYHAAPPSKDNEIIEELNNVESEE